MKKYKRAFVAIIVITIFAVAIYTNVSIGIYDVEPVEGKFHDLKAPAPTGNKYTLNGSDAIFRYWNIFCIEHAKELEDVNNIEYDVKYKAEIRGQEASYYTPDGRLVGTTTGVHNSTMAAIVTPNEFIDSAICEEHRSSDEWGSTGIFGSYEAASSSLNGIYTYVAYSGAQLGVWCHMWDWLYYTSPEEVLNGIGNRYWFDEYQSVPNSGLTGLGAVRCSKEIGLDTELNVDIYFLVNAEHKDLLLVIPYGENLPEEEQNTEMTNFTVTKKWEDGNDRDKIRPSEITVKLYADNELYQTETFGGTGNTWTYVFENLPAMKDGKVINYRVEEVVPDGYMSTQKEV